ncbi:thioesterase family protein [Pirellulales bacterium]|nr:thioesterase family protein [Pirellulales bacterium]
MPGPFRTSRIVEFHDTDMAGIMHFASFFHYMESAEHELIRTLGFSIHSDVAGETLSFPRVRAACDYRSPARCEEELDIAVSVSEIGRSSVTYTFNFTHAGRDIAGGAMTSVCCRVVPGTPIKSVALPAELSESLRSFSP